MHPTHIRAALYAIGVEPQEETERTLRQQLDDAVKALNVPHVLGWYDDPAHMLERAFTLGMLSADLRSIEASYAGIEGFERFHALGINERHQPIPRMPWEVVDPTTADRFTRYFVKTPITFGAGAETFFIPVLHSVAAIEFGVQVGSNRYLLANWGGLLVLIGSPETRLALPVTLEGGRPAPLPKRDDIFAALFEAEGLGVWDRDETLLDAAKKAAPEVIASTLTLRNVQTARTAYRKRPDAMPWVVARLDAMAFWRKATKKLDPGAGDLLEQGMVALPWDVAQKCRRPEALSKPADTSI